MPAPPWSIARDRINGVLVSTVDRDHGLALVEPGGFEVYRSDTQECALFAERDEAIARHVAIVVELQGGLN